VLVLEARAGPLWKAEGESEVSYYVGISCRKGSGERLDIFGFRTVPVWNGNIVAGSVNFI
jgi:hypothetical protein